MCSYGTLVSSAIRILERSTVYWPSHTQIINKLLQDSTHAPRNSPHFHALLHQRAY